MAAESMEIRPTTLTGKLARLEALGEAHIADLAAAGKDESIWEFMRYGQVTTQERMAEMVRMLLARQAQGTDLPFAVIHQASDRAVGMTRFMNIEPVNRAVEIGGTWYAPQHQRTGLNTECKYLLLRHAFETWRVIRVQFKADLRNLRSQNAVERLGAVREGVLRDHIILPDGTVRSSVFYSILAKEWPSVKARLERLLS